MTFRLFSFLFIETFYKTNCDLIHFRLAICCVAALPLGVGMLVVGGFSLQSCRSDITNIAITARDRNNSDTNYDLVRWCLFLKFYCSLFCLFCLQPHIRKHFCWVSYKVGQSVRVRPIWYVYNHCRALHLEILTKASVNVYLKLFRPQQKHLTSDWDLNFILLTWLCKMQYKRWLSEFLSLQCIKKYLL